MENDQFVEISEEEEARLVAFEEEQEDEEPTDEFDPAFISDLVDKCMIFIDHFSGNPLHAYQRPFARRIVESLIINDAAELTALAARQSGKSEIIANVMAGLMVLLPRLATIYPDLLEQYKDGLMVGVFAPTTGQVETLFGRIIDRLTSDHAIGILQDPEINDRADRKGGVVKTVRLRHNRSFVSMMTANPKAKIESRSFHVIIIDECQEANDFVIDKSITPMLAAYAGTMIKTGTPTTEKNNFYRAIQTNKRRQTGRGQRQAHFQWTWKDVIKSNAKYAKFIQKEKLRLGEDSDEFMMSYACRWLLERGMFTTEAVMDSLGDSTMQIIHAYHASPVVVGIDPARKVDSTVVTVVFVDWDRPDEFGYFHHRVLNWMEIQGDNWEEQYHKIVEFLKNYNVLKVGVDGNGVGDAVADRLKVLLPHAEEVVCVSSSPSEQSARFKHLQVLMDRKKVVWPAHSFTKRLKTYKRFRQQMLDVEKNFSGPNMVVQAPDEAHAHDDYVDSLSIACALTLDYTMPMVESSANVFRSSSSRR